ncbi:hypothetical protein Tco_0897219, partial [Tanacetum coccineum]
IVENVWVVYRECGGDEAEMLMAAAAAAMD